ncbi:MAG TPA: (2Fe-2S)-binding protein [Candidatus Baltobacteraceae bacterium]|jgi:aerobic-type carbon monoxide dehydrogenase small subunit (CoxS/CutS family)
MIRTSKSEHASINLRVDGKPVKADVPPRLLLCDFLRSQCGAKGVHVGCEHGVCGACTILVDGRAVRSCLMFAVQAEGAEVKTVASLGSHDNLSPLQEAFRAHHALQCGFCTPGILISAQAFLTERPSATRREVEELLAGHLCRCTGYTSIVDAIMATEETTA